MVILSGDEVKITQLHSFVEDKCWSENWREKDLSDNSQESRKTANNRKRTRKPLRVQSL